MGVMFGIYAAIAALVSAATLALGLLAGPGLRPLAWLWVPGAVVVGAAWPVSVPLAVWDLARGR